MVARTQQAAERAQAAIAAAIAAAAEAQDLQVTLSSTRACNNAIQDPEPLASPQSRRLLESSCGPS